MRRQIAALNVVMWVLLKAALVHSASHGPEDAIRAYVNAFAHQDFRGAMTWFHEDYQKAIRGKMLSIVETLRPEDQLKVIEEYGVKTVAEFKAMPLVDVVAINMARKFRKYSDEQLKTIMSTRVEIEKSTRLPDGRHELDIRTVISRGGREFEKRERFILTIQGGMWKISGSKTFNDQYRDKSGIELFAPNQAL